MWRRPDRAADALRSMSRLEGGPWTVSSASRSCLRSRSRPGACREPPAPAGVPVERRVRIGLVRPFTVRPVSGVWERLSSRPVPPNLTEPGFFRAEGPVLSEPCFPRAEGRRAVVFRPVLAAPLEVDSRAFLEVDLADPPPVFLFPGRGGFVVFLRRALPWGVLAPAVFLRPVARCGERRPRAVRAFARARVPALPFEGVFFWPRDFAFFFVLAISSCRSKFRVLIL